jgi:hypothetical protein
MAMPLEETRPQASATIPTESQPSVNQPLPQGGQGSRCPSYFFSASSFFGSSALGVRMSDSNWAGRDHAASMWTTLATASSARASPEMAAAARTAPADWRIKINVVDDKFMIFTWFKRKPMDCAYPCPQVNTPFAHATAG